MKTINWFRNELICALQVSRPHWPNVMDDKKLTYIKTVTVPIYPKVMFLCGVVIRLEKRDSVPEVFQYGRWCVA